MGHSAIIPFVQIWDLRVTNVTFGAPNWMALAWPEWSAPWIRTRAAKNWGNIIFIVAKKDEHLRAKMIPVFGGFWPRVKGHGAYWNKAIKGEEFWERAARYSSRGEKGGVHVALNGTLSFISRRLDEGHVANLVSTFPESE